MTSTTSTPSLGTVALEIVNRHEEAAQTFTRAYQSGVERFAERVSSRLQAQQLPLVPEAVKSTLLSAQQQSSEAFLKGIKANTAAITTLNQNIANGLRASIERTTGAVEKFDAATKGTLGRVLNQFVLPSAQLSLSLANLLVQGAQRLEARAANDGATDVQAKQA